MLPDNLVRLDKIMLIILSGKFIQITELSIMQTFPANAKFYYKCEIKTQEPLIHGSYFAKKNSN